MNRTERGSYLQALFDHIQDAIFFLDDNACIIDVNPAACELLGYQASELQNRDVWKVLRVRSAVEPQVLWEAFLHEGKQQGETQLRARDDKLTVVEVNAVANIQPGIHMAILHDITERVQQERAGQRREAFLAHLLDQLPAIVWYADSELCLVSIAGRGVEEWQIDRETLVGRPLKEILHEMGDDETFYLLQRALAGEAGMQEVHYRGLSLRLFVTPFHRPEGGIEGVIGLGLDQSEQKRLEQDLFQKNQSLRLLIEHATDIISRVDLEGRHLYVNPVITKFTGLPPEALIGKTNADLGMPDHLLSQWHKAAQTAIESRTEHIVEFVFPTPDGDRHFQSRLVPEFGPDGAAHSLLNIARDITPLKQVEEELRRTQSLLTAILDHAPMPIFARALDGTQLLVNRAWEEFTGVPREKVIGRKTEEYLPPQMAANFQKSDRAVLQSGARLDIEERLQDASSTTHHFHTIKFPLYDSAMQISAVAGIAVDITPIKQVQDDLRRYNERLQILHEIDRNILAARSVAEIAQSVVLLLPKLLPCNRASVGMVDPQRKGLKIIAVHVEQGVSFGVGSYLDLGSSTLERVLKTNAPYVALDLENYRRFPIIEAIRKSGMRWVTLFPIRVRGQLLATLNLASVQPDAFSASHLALARAVADSLSIALQQSQLNEEVQHQREQLEVLRQMTLELTAELDLDALLRSLVQHAIDLCKGTAGGLYLYRPEEDMLEWVVALGEGLAPLGSRLRRGEGLSGKVWEQGKALVVDDYTTWPGRYAPYEPYEWQTVVAVPIRWGETLLGVLNLQRGHLPFTSEESNLLNLFANQAAIALHNAHLFEAERTAYRHAEQIREATSAIASALDLERVLAALLLHLQKVVPYDSATVFLHEEDHLVAVAVRGHPAPDKVIGQHFPAGQGIFPLIRQSGQPVILEDAQRDGDFMSWAGTDYVRGWLAVPLIVRGVVIGYLTLDSQQVGRYNQQEAALVLTFANQATVAVENARLFEAERHNRQQAEMLQAANAALTESLDLQRVLDQLLALLGRMIPFDSAAVQMLEEHSRVVTRAARGFEPWADPAQIVGSSVEASPGSVVRDMFLSGKGYRIADTRDEPRWKTYEATAYIRSWLGVPLIAGGEWIGIFALDKAEPNFFTEEHVRLAESLATQAAVAIQNARLFEEVQRGRHRLQMLSTQLIEVQENERRHIARELHDEIGQILTGLSLSLEMGSRPPLERSQQHLQQARALISDLMERVDALSLDLRPSMLDDLGLLPALLWHFERYEMQSEVHVHFKQSGLADTRFNNAVETAAYRIVQEALTNVARHAGVDTVWVRVVADSEVIHIQIRDEGKGFNPDAPNEVRESRGLSGIYERATLLGGMLLIQSQRGQGTLLTVVLPVDGKHA